MDKEPGTLLRRDVRSKERYLNMDPLENQMQQDFIFVMVLESSWTMKIPRLN